MQYLQVTDYIGEFSNPILLYYKKSYPGVNEIDNLDQKLDLLIAHLGEFPENLRIMSLILLTTGIKKGQLFLLRNADFYYKDENSWYEGTGYHQKYTNSGYFALACSEIFG